MVSFIVGELLFANLPNDVGWFQMANGFDVLFYGSIVISFAKKIRKQHKKHITHYINPLAVYVFVVSTP